jgi:putative hydrolase of the HAD superfamily
MTEMKAVLFDMHGTLVHLENNVTDNEISDYLFSRGYEVSPQQLRAAWSFVAFIDYPKYGYKSWHSFFSRILWRLEVRVDEETLNRIAKLLESRPYQLYPDATEALPKVKKSGLKTATVTTIALFQFKKAIAPIKKYFDFIMTGYEAGCDKTNPRMYRRVLEVLNVNPEEAIMIGDDIPTDILLPRSLGIRAVLLDRERKGQECPQAEAVVNDLKEAAEIIIGKFKKT